MDSHPRGPGLDASALRDGLMAPHLPWRRLDVIDETGSTNADLLARAGNGEDIDGVVLLTEHQKSGRGRHGRRWSSPPRAQLALSVGVGADAVPKSGWGWLTLATGVAVADALAELTGIEAGLKWPNDVVVGDGKLAGILAEVAAPEPAVVVGLGLNVTTTAAELADLPTPATSLAILDAPPVDRNILAGRILGLLGARILSWRGAAGADDALMADYRRCSRTLGTRVRAGLPGGRHIEGVADLIDEFGRLRIDTGAGSQTVSAGDITHLRPGV
jgi:BirA family biotin operon repressor/biotin-[acetyl-CoA-carboxylase] ligase